MHRNQAPTPPITADPRWVRLLNKVEKDPDSALEDPRCLMPPFLDRYFDLCDGKALEAPYVAQDYAAVALQLAEKTGDPHLIHRARGVAVHAFIGSSQWQQAADALGAYQENALKCCQHCASDWWRRSGDLLVETSDPRAAHAFLELSEQVLDQQPDDDGRGRLLFLRGMAYHFCGDGGRAINAAGETLALLSLSSPRGYFLDATAFLACFLESTQESNHAEAALKHLKAFRHRLKGLKGWHEVRDRMRWVEGLLHARLGQPRRARARLEIARKGHVKRAPHHWALAIGVDEAMVYSRHERAELYDYSIRRILTACANDLKLEAGLEQRLARLCEILEKSPWHAGRYLSEFRRSFMTPVPGLLVDLTLKNALRREWPYGPEAPSDD